MHLLPNFSAEVRHLASSEVVYLANHKMLAAFLSNSNN